MPKLKTHEEYENELFNMEIDYFPIESYKGAKIPILHECIREHRWLVRPDNILQGKGCPTCRAIDNTKTDEEYKNRLPADIISIEPYSKAMIPINHQHITCGHIWKVTPNSILRGTGCPNCAIKGFKPNIPGKLYFVSFTHLGETYYKIGITNKSIRKRFEGDWNRYSMKLIWCKEYSIGVYAHKREQELLTMYKDYLVDTNLLISGNTETISVIIPEEIT